MTRTWKKQRHRPDYQKSPLHILTLLINGTAPSTHPFPARQIQKHNAQLRTARREAPQPKSSPRRKQNARSLASAMEPFDDNPEPPEVLTPAFGPSIKSKPYTAQGSGNVAPMPNPNQEGAPRTPAATQTKMDISPSPPRQVNQKQDRGPSPPSPKPPNLVGNKGTKTLAAGMIKRAINLPI